MRKANKKLMVGIGIVGTIALLGLLAMNVNAQPSGFVFIDENDNGQFDAGEWNSTSIQDAVDNASNGDTIYVWDGHYYEDVIVNKTVTIIGNTTIDAMSYSYGKNTSLEYDEFGFWVEADNVNISGFYMWCMGYDQSGIHLNGTQYCNISGNMISGDPSDGICIENSSHNMIYNNIISQNGEGIWLINGSNNTISNNQIDNNFIGIWMTNSSGYNTIEMNNVSYNEYGIVYEPQPYYYTTPCWNTISYNNISYNDIWGIMMGNTSNETVLGNCFYWNGMMMDGYDGFKGFGPPMFYGGAVDFRNVNDSYIGYNTVVGPFGFEIWNCTNVTVEHNDLFGMHGDDGWLPETYEIYAEVGGVWELVKEFHVKSTYEELSVPLPKGTDAVRITQHGGTAAHIDYVALRDDSFVQPATATIAGEGSVLNKLLYRDWDVADVWGKTVELTWDGVHDSATLIMVANEEFQPRAVRAYYTPHIMYPSFMEPYTLQDNGNIVVDGIPDVLGTPDFSDFWRPLGSGHPWGDTYVWLRCDGEYLYATMEITSDNLG